MVMLIIYEYQKKFKIILLSLSIEIIEKNERLWYNVRIKFGYASQ